MSKPNLEALKEIGRWIVLFFISWIIASLLGQANLVPESWIFKISVFTFNVPLREVFIFGLTMIGRYIDKFLHENAKQDRVYQIGETPISGLLPF